MADHAALIAQAKSADTPELALSRLQDEFKHLQKGAEPLTLLEIESEH